MLQLDVVSLTAVTHVFAQDMRTRGRGKILLVASVLIHAWVGMRNIWMDYVKHSGVRFALQVATVLWLVGCAGWAMQILWKA